MSAETCGGHVVLTVMASGLLMSEDGVQQFGLCRQSALEIQIVKSNCNASIPQCEFQPEKRLETVEQPVYVWEMAQVNMEKASSYLQLIESQRCTLQVRRIAC